MCSVMYRVVHIDGSRVQRCPSIIIGAIHIDDAVLIEKLAPLSEVLELFKPSSLGTIVGLVDFLVTYVRE